MLFRPQLVQIWTVERGTRARIVRQKFTVPLNLIGKIKVDGKTLEYGSQIAQYLWVAVHVLVANPPPIEQQETEPIYTFVEGQHIKPIKLSDKAVVNELRKEPFGGCLAITREDERAITLDNLLDTFKRHTWVVYAADEGIGIKFKPLRTQVRVRLVIFVTPDHPTQPPEGRPFSRMADVRAFKENISKVLTLAIIAVPPSGDANNYNSAKSILQIASFTPSLGWFHWYDEDNIVPISRKDYVFAREQLSLRTVQKFKDKRTEEADFTADSEGMAPWKVVVPCAEDAAGIERVIRSGLLPRKVVLALLMVDYWNPVFSYHRARLMRYIPSTTTLEIPSSNEDSYKLGADLIEAIANAIAGLELDPKASPEAEFCDLVRRQNLESFAKEKVRAYVEKIHARLKARDGVLGYMRVAETKRRIFRPPPRYQKPLHPLAEFDMSLPYATQFEETETWVMKEDATVEKEEYATSDGSKIWHPRNTQAHFLSAGCPFSASF